MHAFLVIFSQKTTNIWGMLFCYMLLDVYGRPMAVGFVAWFTGICHVIYSAICDEKFSLGWFAVGLMG